MRPFSLLIKPTSADCNLRCEYCFYLDKANLYPSSSRHRMSDEVLDQLIISYMSTPQPTYSFNWQGGEPTLMGVEFYRRVVALQERYGSSGAVVSNGLQTNATHIDEALARHFAQYRFLIGCSLDGPPAIHDRYRRTPAGYGTHARVMSGIDTLKRHGVEFNVLVLVSRANVKQAAAVYRYLKEQGFLYQQFIPCVEFDTDGSLLPFAISGREWGEFLCTLFDQWYPQDVYRVSIRQFDSVLQKMVHGTVNACHMDQNCCQYFVVEHNGDIYPCDFFVEPDLKIGNIMEMDWDAALTSETYQDFGIQKSQWNQKCGDCDCLNYCRGDCLKQRLYAGHTAQNLSWLCEGWQRFYRYTRRHFRKIADQIQRRQTAGSQHTKKSLSPSAMLGRNSLCPCGSGKKYKHCCGRS